MGVPWRLNLNFFPFLFDDEGGVGGNKGANASGGGDAGGASVGGDGGEG